MVPTRPHVTRPHAFLAGLLAAVLIVPTIAYAASPISSPGDSATQLLSP
jgi:hypothetical protein